MRNRLRLIGLLGLFTLLASAQAQMPGDFKLDSDRGTFRLSEARGRFVALHFLLKTECPYCQQHVADITRRAPELAGVTHIFIKPDAESDLKAWREKLAAAGVSAQIYRDPDATLANQFKIPADYAFHGTTMHYPATVLLGPGGREVFRHVGKDNTDRLSFDQLAQKVTELNRSPSLDQYNLAAGQPAINGFDPVSYVESSTATEGRQDMFSAYRGALYRFASAENRAKFAANPEKYVPAYGGWCATAMAEGRKVEIDPRNFKMTGGRLFLFYKGWRGNALADWNKDEANLTKRADEQWNKLAPGDRSVTK
ncbi:MAG: redoxin domain-containing protein [Phycisphaerales bacterium]|nr:redoxin domain-containing protein [Phycisphaerales bacterium]